MHLLKHVLILPKEYTYKFCLQFLLAVKKFKNDDHSTQIREEETNTKIAVVVVVLTIECSAESTVCTTLFQMFSPLDFLNLSKLHLQRTGNPTSSENSSFLTHVQNLVQSCRSGLILL